MYRRGGLALAGGNSRYLLKTRNKKTPFRVSDVDMKMIKNWLRGPDLNRRPSGYEPDELPGCSTPRPIERTILWMRSVASSFAT